MRSPMPKALAGQPIDRLDVGLPLRDTPPGPDRLRVSVTGGKLTATREVGILVR